MHNFQKSKYQNSGKSPIKSTQNSNSQQQQQQPHHAQQQAPSQIQHSIDRMSQHVPILHPILPQCIPPTSQIDGSAFIHPSTYLAAIPVQPLIPTSFPSTAVISSIQVYRHQETNSLALLSITVVLIVTECARDSSFNRFK